MVDLLGVEEALASVLAQVSPLGYEDVAVEDARGRFLAEPAIALTAVPPFASSAMDGFAVRSADCPATLPVEIRIAAGRPADRPLAAGEAMGIATGGAVPDGADAVVPIEHVVARANTVTLPAGVSPGENVRPAGGDVGEGAQVLPAGTRLGPPQLAALAAAGIAAVRCGRRPHAVVLSTGTELRPLGATLAPGEIYESNALMLVAVLTETGADVERIASVADDEAALREAFTGALVADVVVSSGGVSVGPHDLVRQVRRELDVEEIFWGVAMRPGKPLAFGVRGRTLLFGLPGNPVSSLVGALLFACPALRALQGAASPEPRWSLGTLGAAVRRNPARDDFVRARIETAAVDGLVLQPIVGQESHMIVRTAAADALAHVPRGEGELAAGSPVRYLPLA